MAEPVSVIKDTAEFVGFIFGVWCQTRKLYKL